MSNLIVPETVYRGLEERLRDLEAQLQAAQTQIATVRRQALDEAINAAREEKNEWKYGGTAAGAISYVIGRLTELRDQPARSAGETTHGE